MRVDKDTRSCVDMVEDTDEEEEIVGNIGCTGHWATLRRVTGSQGAGSSGVFDSAKDLRAFENEQGATSEAMPVVEKVRGIFSKLRRSWTKTANPRPPRPSLFRPRRELNSKFGVALDELEMMRTIGTGGFGRVKLVKHTATGKFLALKQLKKSEILRLRQTMHVNAERSILAELNHPYIIRLHATYQDPHHVYMLLDFAPGGDFFSHLRAQRRFSPDTVKHYVGCIVLALDYVHSMDVVYRDLKPENLLLDIKGRVKLADFGLAKKVKASDRTWTLCGTPEYLAPEIILTKGHNKAVDWWALGVVIYEFLAGYPPFYNENTFVIYQQILSGVLKFPPHFSDAARDLITKLLQPDQSRRLGCMANSAEDIKNHKFFAEIDFAALEDGSKTAPIYPRVSHPGDTCNFDNFPEDSSPPTRIDDAAQDFFKDF